MTDNHGMDIPQSSTYDQSELFSCWYARKKAILDYTKAIALDPEMSKAYYNRGYAYANSGNITKAIDDFEHYLTFDITESTEKEIRDLIELLRQ